MEKLRFIVVLPNVETMLMLKQLKQLTVRMDDTSWYLEALARPGVPGVLLISYSELRLLAMVLVQVGDFCVEGDGGRFEEQPLVATIPPIVPRRLPRRK